jgi:hypothetical protein
VRKLLAGFTLGLASLAAQAALVEIQPLDSPVNVGDEVIVNIVGSDFTDLMGGGVDVSFTPGVLELGAPTNANVTLADPPWDSSFPRTEVVDDSAGTLTDFSFNQFAGVSGSFPIVRLTFRATAPGIASLSVLASNAYPFANESGQIFPSFGDPVQVLIVPEPGTWGFLGAGLALMILIVVGPQARRRLKI